MMKIRFIYFVLFLGLISCGGEQVKFERESDFNFDWKFTLMADTTMPTNLPLDDTDWRDVHLPHDWSVEMDFNEDNEGCTGYLPGGVGVYQKHFETPASPEEMSTFVLFDGVYNRATFWLNGQKLGENPYGYSPTYFDLTDKLKTDGTKNILTVHVDHSRYADSRWYTGSGIYRNVKLVTVNKVHIPIWGTYLTTPKITDKEATVHIEVDLANQLTEGADVVLTTKILNKEGKEVASASSNVKVAAESNEKVSQDISVANPELWGIQQPNMYSAITCVEKDGKLIDQYKTPFGFRTIRFDKESGFYLNGVNTDVKGVCIHHDAGLVGAAVPKGVWKRRIEKLQAAGVNAIRTAHNPYSQEFYDLCDEMGVLVQTEIFDELDYPKDKRMNYHDRRIDYITRGYTEHFQEWGKSDLERTMLRDRNHPSIIQWSIGNEIEWTYLHYRFITGHFADKNDPQNSGKYWWGVPPLFSKEELRQRYEESEKGEYILAETAEKVNAWTKAMDTTRPTTANLVIPTVSHVSGYADAVDHVGYSYRNGEIAWGIENFPHQQITINENPGTWDDWKQVLNHPQVFSIFMWTGIDYMGERHGDWPNKSGWGDILDLAGFKYQGWNYFKSIWINEPHISLGTLPVAESGFEVTGFSAQQIPANGGSYTWRNSNMHWNYEEGDTIVVEVCSNHTIAELLVNGRSVGRQSMSECPDRLFRWTVPYEAGTITARAGFDGQEIIAELHTTGKPVAIKVEADKTDLAADGYDVSHFEVFLVDAEGRKVRTENAKISFDVQGDAKLLGVDNGATDYNSNFQTNSVMTAKGHALAIIQSTKTAGAVKVVVSAEGFEDQEVTLNIK